MILFAAETMLSERDRSKLESLYNAYSQNMYVIAHQILNDHHLAEDAVQQAYIKIIERLDKIDEVHCNKTKAFLVIVIRSVAIDLYRKRNVQENPSRDIEETWPAGEEAIDEQVIRAELSAQIAEKIKLLPANYSDVITLKYTYGYSDEEIACMLNITWKNARVRLHRAKRSLFKLLTQGEVNING